MYKVNPTLLDKLIADTHVEHFGDSRKDAGAVNRTQLAAVVSSEIERFNEEGLKKTVLRELNWLLNTMHLGSELPLNRYPEVETSVLNFGVADLSTTTSRLGSLHGHAADIRAAIAAFEPRIRPESLIVEPSISHESNRVAYLIKGDLTQAVNALPVEIMTLVEVDTGSATVSDR